MSVVLSEECVRRRVLGPRTGQDGRSVWVVARGRWVECECLSPDAAVAALRALDDADGLEPSDTKAPPGPEGADRG